ncbi:MAG: hypothetical protein H0U21_16890 [Acidimicrobiia bacterium]|nr:hypothetical protein [Acidimicrobiia bacterium]
MDIRDFMHGTSAIGSVGAAFYFHPTTIAAAKEHGLDGFRLYFLGRGGVLGDVEARVVASAFGYFEPGLLARMWDSAKAVMAPRDAARLYLECCHTVARQHLGDVEGLDEFCAAAETVNNAIDPAGLALYAGISAEPLADDAPARALQLCTVLREARGSAHLVALVASGLSPRLAHLIRRPDDDKLFGWNDQPAVGEDDRARWAAAEELTDRLLEPAYSRLDERGQQAFLRGLDGMAATFAI